MLAATGTYDRDHSTTPDVVNISKLSSMIPEGRYPSVYEMIAFTQVDSFTHPSHCAALRRLADDTTELIVVGLLAYSLITEMTCGRLA